MTAREAPAELIEVLGVLDGVRGRGNQYEGRCPAHEDKRSSLTISVGDDGLPILSCKAGCDYPALRDALVGAGVPEASLRGGSGNGRSAAPTVRQPKPKKQARLPDEANLAALSERLLTDPDRRKSLKFLTKKRGLSEEVIARFGLAYTSNRYWLPIRDAEGQLLNVRKYLPNPGADEDKMLNVTGRGEVVLYPLAVLADDPEAEVFLFEGELDALCAISHGLVAVSGTGGAGSPPADLSALADKVVNVVYDCDAPGRDGARKAAERLLPIAKSVHVVDVGLGAGEDGTDWFVKYKRTADDLRALASRIEPATAESIAEPPAKAVLAEVEKLRIREAARRQFRAEQMIARNQAASVRGRRVMDGAEFILDLADARPTLWGLGDQVLWMEGEGLLIVGSDGTGKTTLAQQLLLSRLGVRGTLLDFPVAEAEGRVLYLAMDRPDQARRSFARMIPKDFHDEYRDVLRDRLVTWSGPLPVDPLSAPEALAEWISGTHGSDITDVFVDSYKDLAPGLSEDAVGSGLNSAMQEVLARGINWLGLHHQRKANGDNKTPIALADVFGSRWLTAGQGSVLMIAGDAGDRVVELRHLKEPLAKVPTLVISHDHANGRTTRVEKHMDALDVIQEAGDEGVTINDVCQAMYPGQADNPAIKKRVGRALKRLADKDDRVSIIPATKGGEGGSRPARYVLTEV